MKKEIVYLMIAASAALVPLGFTTGCASSHHEETTKTTVDDKEIAGRVKTALNSDPNVKGTQVSVTSLNGVVQLSGFVDTPTAKERAGQIASSTPGVAKVYNDLIIPIPTGR
jgi:osmotically-inducible protein OsmY